MSTVGEHAPKKKRSILERLNLALPEERSTAERDPKAAQSDPENGEAKSAPKWDRIRRRFVESDVSLRALADEFTVPYPTLKRRARSERWRAARESFRQELDEQLRKAALVSRAEAHAVQERAARETIGIFARVFEERARALRADPASKSAAEDLGKLIQLQLDVCELGLTILGDTEIDWRAERLSARQAAPRIH